MNNSEQTIPAPINLRPLENLGLPTRIVAQLKANGISTLGELVRFSLMELSSLQGFGLKRAVIVFETLSIAKVPFKL